MTTSISMFLVFRQLKAFNTFTGYSSSGDRWVWADKTESDTPRAPRTARATNGP